MTNYNTAEEKTAESSGETPAVFDLPSTWRCETYRRNGCGKRIAVFEHREKNETVTISPWKTYDIGGLPNAHRVVHIRDNQRNVIAEGVEIETVIKADAVAFAAIHDRSPAEFLDDEQPHPNVLTDLDVGDQFSGPVGTIWAIKDFDQFEIEDTTIPILAADAIDGEDDRWVGWERFVKEIEREEGNFSLEE